MAGDQLYSILTVLESNQHSPENDNDTHIYAKKWADLPNEVESIQSESKRGYRTKLVRTKEKAGNW
jgi:hypothetical protein